MTLLREALEVHRRGTVDERRRWVLRHPMFSSLTVCAVVTVAMTVTALVLRPGAVSVVGVGATFGAGFVVARLLLLVADRSRRRQQAG